ncbi:MULTISPECIES: dihydrolipoyl dehydrogenase [unclassified Rhodococcus (in: high G+C Gram-positive bacteria)]|uniref:dihydrolipoyl dehydrogenase n=1 Tax=unclassified Rhodococcus (in: high G+C Gram-positive bacteria) TaxID=192944 RepID=UPI00163AB5B8|nr:MULTISPECIES: dihydrolipoyl dehydrogenase [unclassified Rhodococcus (in: high G+C Gram-positive bacteria)]MBC2640377.1 dihydrolipoyl dehydrogenase [Rhodococcus sp. 3A]MBC2894877.1 dihydrolipoyl dehydrogenase [Rhodococcus sp. 4CII]
MSRSADVVILGGGSGGYAAAIRSAELGRSVILIEENELGGTCLHQGCIPTKALLHAAEVADSARTASQFGVEVTFGGVDLEKVLSYKNTIVTRLHKGLQGLVDSHGITVVNGRGRLVGPNGVEVDGELITGAAVVLATGSSPKTVPGIAIGGRVVTSDEALVLPSVPKKAIILGGGVIGVEFASVWASFGASVTIVEAMPRLVPNEDETVSKYLERAFRRRKIAAKTGVRVTDVTQDDDSVSVTLDSGDVLDADVVLVAVGRGPNTDSMGYEQTGVVLDRGFVVTSDRLRTTVPNVYAVGDIVAGLQLAHRGFQQGIFVAEEIAGLRPDVIDETGIPRVTYSHPEVASVGLTVSAAREKFGGDVETVTYDLAGNGKSQILKTSGAVTLVVAPDGVVVGVHMVGDRVGELIGEAQLLYNFQVEAAQAAKFVHAHPTQGEALGEALLAVAGKPLHVHA